MKKTLLISCLIIFLSFGFTSSAFDDIYDDAMSDAVNGLVRYSIINGYEDGTFRPKNTITRAEFAKIIIAAANLYSRIDYDISFDDTQSHWANEYIILAKQYGIVNGTSATTFEPDSNVTYEQAIKMIVCMLGYGNEAESLGGYPNGYISVSEKLGLTDSLQFTATENATRGNIALMISKALDVKYIVTDNEGNIITDVVNDLTLRKIHEDLLEFNS